MRVTRALSLLLLLAFAACSAPPEPPPDLSSVTPPPRCPVLGVVQHHDGGPMAGVTISGSASEEVDETRARQVDSGRTISAADGSFALELTCGARVRLEFDGWIWAIHPADLIAEPAPAPLEIRLLPAREVRLWVTDGAAQRLEGARLVPPGGGEGQPIPFEGLRLEGIPYGRVIGTIEADSQPSRTWRMNRSDELEEVGPMHFEATVRLGEDAPLWIEVPDLDADEIVGAWCVQDGQRGERCKLRDGGWHCPCSEQRVALAAQRWDVAVVRDVVGRDLEFEQLPAAVAQCLTVPGGERLRIHPAGVDDVALLGKRGPAEGFCLRLPRAEAVEVVVEGEPERRLLHRADQPGDVVLR